MAGWSSMFGKIETEEQALQVIREASKGFFWLAGMQAVLALLIYPAAVLDAALYAILGYWLRKSNSKVAALLLLLIALGALGVTVMNRLGVGEGMGGRNIFLAVIVFWVSVRAVQATFKISSFGEADAGAGRPATNAKVRVYG